MERWPSGSGAPASEVTTVSTAANVPSTFHAKKSTATAATAATALTTTTTITTTTTSINNNYQQQNE